MGRISCRRAPRKGIGMAKLRREETGDFRRWLLAVSSPNVEALQERRRLFSGTSGFYASNNAFEPARSFALGERRIWRRLLRQSHRPLIAVCYPKDIRMRDFIDAPSKHPVDRARRPAARRLQHSSR